MIIGFGLQDTKNKLLYDYANPDAEPMEVVAKNINPYLVDTDNLIIPSRNEPICQVPEMLKGSSPTDDGNLLFTDEEKMEFLQKEPEAKKFIFPLISAEQFLHGRNRWCLWLIDASPAEIRALPEVQKRVNGVREFRLKSKKAATVKYADTPYIFMETRQPTSDYVLIPRHSSENRRYIPMAFFSKDYIASDSCVTVPNATLYHFGVLTSAMHMAWTRQVCGRIKSDYRYSNNIVYNNYPWPESITEEQKEKVAKAAQGVLDARQKFPDSTLADLYDPTTMPKVLVDAHRELDNAVDRCYQSKPFNSELERLEFLFALYRKYTEPLTLMAEKKTKRSRKSK